MPNSRGLRIAALATLAVVLCGCYQLVYRAQDEDNLRRQLHIPADVPAILLDSNPKSAGFFGREGLQIQAVFQFDAGQLQRYLVTMNDPAAWKPARLLSYSPDQAEEYSTDSMRWRDLPMPAWTNERLRDWPSLPEIQRIENGRVYCSTIATVPGGRIRRPDGSHYDSWRYVGHSCAEADRLGASRAVTILGVLDFDARRLHAHIAFAG